MCYSFLYVGADEPSARHQPKLHDSGYRLVYQAMCSFALLYDMPHGVR